jgi:hypothetical protein
MKRTKLLIGSIFGVVLSLGGCDSPPQGGPDMNVTIPKTPEQACPDLTKAYCKKQADCFPFGFTMAFPDAATCETRILPLCLQIAKSSGSKVTGDDIAGCAPKFTSTSCFDYLGQKDPLQICNFPAGTLAAGTACGMDVQCQGLYCNKDGGANCGKCGTRGAAGTDCVDGSDCEKGLACVGATGASKCTALLAQGVVCSTTPGSAPCHPALACRSGTCQTPGKLSDSCTIGSQECDATQGLNCPISGKCTAQLTAGLSQPCGIQGTTYVLCTGGTWCETTQKKCMAPAQDGGACNNATGPRCAAPASCTNSVCSMLDTTTCK